jgi:serine/threonine protein kinase
VSNYFSVEHSLSSNGLVLGGTWNAVPAVLKLLPAVFPWTNPASTFFGAPGLISPVRTTLEQEAHAWSCMDPSIVVATGHGPAGSCVVLRRLPGTHHLPEDGEDAARKLFQAIHQCHSAGVIHNDIRPANILCMADAIHLIDFDASCVNGIGPVGRVGSRQYSAPELATGQCSRTSDLFAAGQLLRQHYTDRTPLLDRIIEQVCQTIPASRTDSARLVCEQLGLPDLAIAPPEAPRIGLTPWLRTHWMNVAISEHGPHGAAFIAQTREHTDEGQRACAGRLLLHAARQNDRQAWLALEMALAPLTHDRELVSSQCEEALRRASGACLETSQSTAVQPDFGIEFRTETHGENRIEFVSAPTTSSQSELSPFDVLQQRPHDPAAWALAIHRLAGMGQLALAPQLLEIGERREGPAAWRLTACFVWAQIGPQEARALLDQAAEHYPDDDNIDILRQCMDWSEAPLGNGEIGIPNPPDSAEAWLLAAVKHHVVSNVERRDRALLTAESLAGPQGVVAAVRTLLTQ